MHRFVCIRCIRILCLRTFSQDGIKSSGDSTIPVIYSVEIVRNGRSFATRTVRAIQRGAVIYALTASFHKFEKSPLYQGKESPINLVPPPEKIWIPSAEEYAELLYKRALKASESNEKNRKSEFAVKVKENGEQFRQDMIKQYLARPIDYRDVPDGQVKGPAGSKTDYKRYVWLKASGSLSEDPNAHAVAMAYASDHSLVQTAIRAQDEFNLSQVAVIVSLDHSVYFHEVCPF
jgi:acyl-CoA thioesterase II